MAQNLWRTQSAYHENEKNNNKKWERLWVGKSLTKQMGLELTFESHECGNIANAVWKRIPNNRSNIAKWAFHQQISGWSVEFSIISQMMIGANEPVGKYEGQKTNKVAKYHQNAGRQKWQWLCCFDDDICKTAQAPLAAEGWPSQ